MTETNLDPGTVNHVVNLAGGGQPDAPAPLAETEAPAEGTEAPAESPEAADAEAEAAAIAATKTAEETKAKLARARAVADKALKERAERRQLEQAIRASQEREQSAHAELARERAAREAAESRWNKVKSEPLSFFEEAGIPASDVAKRAIEENTPESRIAKVEADLKAQYAALEKRIADQQAKEQQAAQEAAMNRARETFVREASDPAKYPALARYASAAPRDLLREAETIMQTAARAGHTYSDAEIQSYLDEKYAKIFSPSDQKSGTATSNATPIETPIGPGTPAKTAAGIPRTLTNKANTRGTAPASFDDLDDLEQKRLMAEQLRQRRRG